jgi:hypothetical protein
MRKRALIAIVAVVAVVASGCYRAYDFIGDTRADRVWITSDGTWHAEGRAVPLWTGPPAGPGTDAVPVPANYDGNAKWEPAVVDDDGMWVTAGAMGTIAFAFPETASASERIPVPADYDGDGKSDPAWYSRVTGTWYVLGRAPVVLGTPGPFPIAGCGNPNTGILSEACRTFISADVPVPGDWDGDGDADPAVWSPLTGEWRTEAGLVTTLGGPSAWPVPADYDGDGVRDAGVWGLGTAEWQVDGLGVIGTFAEGTYPAPADYDGDGRADPSYVFDEFDVEPNTWRGPGLADLVMPAGSWPANIAPWLLRYVVPLTALDICSRINPDRCGLPD